MYRLKMAVMASVLAIPGSLLAQSLPDLGRQGQVGSGTAFNPAISVLLDGNYYRDNSGDGETYTEALEDVRGFIRPHDHEAHTDDELLQGFNLRHAELMFSATVDPYFDAALNLGISEHGIEVEEAYGVTRGLPGGLQLKFGKFLSGIGYINSQHTHDWDFADLALPYHLVFGGHGLNEKGVQLTWMPRTGNYTLLGIEALQGENEGVANFEEARDYDIGGASDAAGPRLFTAFAKYSPDLGYDHALQIGLFGGQSRLHQDLHGSRGEEGETWFAGTDWVYKYDPGRSFGHRSLKLQAEYLYRVLDLEVVGVRGFNEEGEPTQDIVNHPMGEPRRSEQDAAYLQAIYGIAPRWQAGLRYEVAGMTNVAPRGQEWASSDRITAALTWQPTEFSRLRLQAGQSRLASDDAGGREEYRNVYLQYQLALGVHGAHRF